ncbi:MAG: class I SAM-dependent methyltransferase [Lachnospiraceae bacterium]|nr:class I SAM-dependent methyltransferase [Lachnospiraceae bacterium]
MDNPWKDISLDDYEKHMSLDSVKQLQTMNYMMKEQLEAYPVKTAMILGVAGGNGLEHISTEKYRTVYGVDINGEYLRAVSARFARLSGTLKCLEMDLIKASAILPKAELVIANLLIEYIGYEAFQRVILQAEPEYVSGAIQINTDNKKWVSDSPYYHAFDRLDEIHHQMEEGELLNVMKVIGYSEILRKEYALPNGKALVRLDFKK